MTHCDPLLLERELTATLDRSHSNCNSRTLVLVPTIRLADHLERRLADTRAAWLGVEVLHLRALALSILRKRGEGRRVLLPRRLLEALLQRRLAERPDNEWSRFVSRRPGALGRLVSTLCDLREAGIEPQELEACCRTPRERALAELALDHSACLQRLAQAGVVDEAGLIRAALPHAARHALGFSAIHVHGAYEWIGIHLELIRALGHSCPVTAWIPRGQYAVEFARRHLLAPGDRFDCASDGEPDERARLLDSLYDERARPTPSTKLVLRFHHAQGAAAEVRLAVRSALRAVRDGCPPSEVAIVARSLEPYAAAFEEAFDAEGIPWNGSVRTPLRREPIAHDFALLLAVVAQDFPRRKTVEFLRSPRVDWGSLTGGAGDPVGDRADDLSRRAGIIGGLKEWTQDLPAWAARGPRDDRAGEAREVAGRRAAEREAEARRIALALEGLDRRIAPERARTWGEHAARLEALFGSLLPLDEDDERSAAAADGLRGVLDEMRDIERLLGETTAVSFGAVARWLEQAIDAAELPLHADDSGGVRVLDVMQLRGLTFRRVFLIGMNAGRFPRPSREDPVLPDALRRRLSEHTGRPLSWKAAGHLEERLLLGLTIGSARDGVDVSWQRADESGRARTPSLALRELARLTFGEPDLERLLAEAVHLPSHPTHWLEALVATTGLLSPGEERLLVLLRDRALSPALDGAFPDLAPGISMLRSTESFHAVDPAYDGRIGPFLLRPLSVSHLESLGRCPLQFLFGSVLRVGELEEEADPFQLDKHNFSSALHRLLERLYRTLHAEGAFEATPDELERRGLETLERLSPDVLDEIGGRIARRAPRLWEAQRARWMESLRRLVCWDLDRLQRGRYRPVAFEESVTRDIALDATTTIRLSARFDRRFERDEEVLIGDYKASLSLDARVDVTRMLKAQTLQVPLYHLLAGPGSQVELLGLEPREDQADGEPPLRATFPGFETVALAAAFTDTLRTLSGLVARGAFPLHPDRHCEWCAYARACRNVHPPTEERESGASDTEDYRRLAGKTKSGASSPADASLRPGPGERP